MSGTESTNSRGYDHGDDETTATTPNKDDMNDTTATTQVFPDAAEPASQASAAQAPAAQTSASQAQASQTPTSQAQASQTPASQTPTQKRRLPARFSTIIWGVIVLAFAVAVGVFRNAETIPDPLTWITGALIVGGLALVVIGIAAALRRAD